MSGLVHAAKTELMLKVVHKGREHDHCCEADRFQWTGILSTVWTLPVFRDKMISNRGGFFGFGRCVPTRSAGYGLGGLQTHTALEHCCPRF